MATVSQAQVRISEAILAGLRVEEGPLESLESRSVETAPGYLKLLQETREIFKTIDVAEISERQLLRVTWELTRMQISVHDLDLILSQMLNSGRAQIAGQKTQVEQYRNQIAKELDWLEEKIETLTLALDGEFVSEMNRRIERSPGQPVGNPDWKQELATLCD